MINEKVRDISYHFEKVYSLGLKLSDYVYDEVCFTCTIDNEHVVSNGFSCYDTAIHGGVYFIIGHQLKDLFDI